MLIPHILAVGTANPDLYLTQKEVHEFYQTRNLLPKSQKALYDRLLLEGPIKGRYFALPRTSDIINEDSDSQIARFAEQGRKILARACRSAMTEAHLLPQDIGAIVVNTCTGYLCPGFTSYLAEDLGLSNTVKAVDIMGIGCGSAIPNLECGCGMLSRTDGKPAICASVEICSATHLIDDDPGLTVSNCIFGDGAAAAVIGHQNEMQPGIALLDFESGLFPRYREALRYQNQQGHLRNILTRRVPAIGAKCLAEVTEKLLHRHQLRTSDIDWWAVHAGGTEVLRRVAGRFRLPDDKMEASYHIFTEYGNMSSPSVLFALKELMNRNGISGKGLLLAFGAGFTAFAALAHGE